MRKIVAIGGGENGHTRFDGTCTPYETENIEKVILREQINICLDIIHKSFATVATDFNLTKENCPNHTAFMPIEKLEMQFDNGNPMFLYKYENEFVGYFSLNLKESCVELNNLSVLPEYRHLGIGANIVNYAKNYVKNNLCANKIDIGIIEENEVLKNWYEQLGFVHIGTKKIKNLPFTVGFMEIEL